MLPRRLQFHGPSLARWFARRPASRYDANARRRPLPRREGRTTAMNARIVDARPEHAPFIAWVTLAAFRSHLERGFWDFILDAPDDQMLRFLEVLATTEREHWCHHSIFVVAEVDGRPVSALSGYFEEEHGGLRLRDAMAEANEKAGRTQDPAAMARAMTILQVLPEHLPNAWIVENVATLPEFRRRGLVDRLMAEVLERGHRRGATIADISVFIGNDPAQRAYEKAGFAAIGEKRHPDFEAVYGCPGTRTLRRPLSVAAAK